jgi:hypothetical protein
VVFQVYQVWIKSEMVGFFHWFTCQWWWFQWRIWFVPSVPGYLREQEGHKPDTWRNPTERNHMGWHLENEVLKPRPSIRTTLYICWLLYSQLPLTHFPLLIPVTASATDTNKTNLLITLGNTVCCPITLLKPTGHVMHQQLNILTTVRSAHPVFMCFVSISEQRLLFHKT